MRNIHDDRQMRLLLEYRHSADVERVARPVFKGADTAFHQDDVGVAAANDVLGSEHCFFHGCAKAPLEQHGLLDLTQRPQQEAVLHVARTHPEEVNIVGHHRD